MHRHQFDRGDAEPAEMADDRRMCQAGEGAPLAAGLNVPALHGQAAYMRLIDDRV